MYRFGSRFSIDSFHFNSFGWKESFCPHLQSCQFLHADMSNFSRDDAARQYDAIVSLFSAIGYVFPIEHLHSTMRASLRELRPGGVILVH
jgi:hypothetical protein